MMEGVLVLNAGSSSLKVAAYAADGAETADDAPWLKGAVERIGGASWLTLTRPDGARETTEIKAEDHRAALSVAARRLAQALPAARIVALGHRIVHGGPHYSGPAIITPSVLAELETLIPLAPLHQPQGLAGVRSAEALFPGALQVACFDTAFHAQKPWVQESFGLPSEAFDAGVRRYGFHGVSCQSIMRTLRAEGFPAEDRRLVIAHLGNGCSVTAVKNGAGYANSMGFSTLDGLLMGTRSGRLDPGVLLYWLRQGKSPEDIETLLYKRAGLLGVSGLSNDVRDLSASPAPEAARALEMFVARAVEEIARMAGAMNGLDCVVFCGGVGENAAALRDRIVAGLGFLRQASGAPLDILVRATDEERELMLTARAMRASAAQGS